MTARTFIIIFAVLGFVMLSSAAPENREPKVSLKQALAKAEKYVADKKIDISSLYLASVYRRTISDNPKQDCWTVIWAPKNPYVMDGELFIYIYDDGHIKAGGSA